MSEAEFDARVEALLDRSFGRDFAERERLADGSGEDPRVVAEVKRLLALQARAGGFLETPAPELAAAVVAEAAAAEESERRTAARVGPYRLVRELGRGGMGSVYLAQREDGGFEQVVALKLVRPGVELDERLLRRFREERQILAALQHPHIARLLDGGVTETAQGGPGDGVPYFAMEYVDGTPLDRYCDARALSVGHRLRLFCQVCDAVQYAHAALVIHRDLKPANILVTAPHPANGGEPGAAGGGGEVKLLDFGIARLIREAGAAEGPTGTGTYPMTPAYASPEQVAGRPLTTATDVYSLGVLLYELLCGRHPFEAANAPPLELARRILEVEPERPSAAVAGPSAEAVARARSATPQRLRRRLRGDLDTIVLNALRKEPERRYASAEQLAADVRRHLAHLPVRARPDTAAYRAAKFVRRHRVGVPAAAAFLLLLVGFTATTWLQSVRIAQERDRAEMVAGFLIELFGESDPFRVGPSVFTVRDVLDRGAARIDLELAGEPAMRAKLSQAIGQAYLGLGFSGEALPLLDSAVAVRRRLRRGDHPELAASLYLLSYALRVHGDAAAAEPLAREAVAMRRRLFGADHVEVASALNGLGMILNARGRDAEAEGVFEEALAIGRRALGGRHFEVSASLNSLGSIRSTRGEHAAAEPLLREALEIRRARFGDRHPYVATTLSNLAGVAHALERREEAESMYREVVAMRRATVGDEHLLTAISLVNLGQALAEAEKHVAAEEAYRAALDVLRRTVPADHPRTAQAALGLGRLLSASGRPAEAEPLLREALATRRQKLAAGNWQIAEAESALGDCLSRAGQSAEAGPLLLSGYEGVRAGKGEAHAATRQALRAALDHLERGGQTGAAAALRARAAGLTPPGR